MSVSRRWFAPCPKGLEYLLVDELAALGADDVREALAGVHFAGELAVAYRVCLWSRLASRVLMPLSGFPAADADALHAGVAAIDWEQHLAPGATLAIDAHGRTAGLVNAQFAALRAKDAIVDQLRARRGERPSIDTERPDVRLDLRLHRDEATLSLDLAGSALFLRGYRRGAGAAPLKENLAAAILLRAHWPSVYADGGMLIDPVCGSGTLLIEAAWMAADVAPGLHRTHWGFSGWAGHRAELWEALLAEARARAESGLRALRPAFLGADRDAAVLGACKANAQAAGVAGFVTLRHQDVSALSPPPGAPGGLVVANPPYGERLGDVAALRATYAALGEALERRFVGWRAAVITSEAELGHALGLRADRRYVLFNGALECTLLCFDRIGPRESAPVTPKPLSEAALGLRNRLDKNLRHLRRWLTREHVSCFRAYDADLPDYAAAIDVYHGWPEDAPGDGSAPAWLHVQEYAPPRDIPDDTARRRLREILRVAGEVFAVPRERVAVKTRRPQARHARYQRQDEQARFLMVEEGGLRFRVNLFDYLDTGLFLDHRPTRARLRELARGARFLNLFCYTASASVYAAAGGARETVSVDLSANYLEWAGRNLTANGFTGAAHRLVQADVPAWLAAERGFYDLVFIDPPTFSNSKRAEDFDVQREHVHLLGLTAARLAPDGLIVFSNNFRRFRLDHKAVEALGLAVRELGARSVPPDFARDPKIHHCFELRRR